MINFKVDNKNKCPYKALNLGDSDSVKVSDNIYIAGFPGNSSVPQFTSGRVSYIGGDIDGYGISYTATTAGGMSGAPVINTWGKVIAVHKGKQGIFNGGIRINSYKENIPKVPTKPQPGLKAEDFNNQGNDLYNSGDYQKALEAYDKAIAIEPDYHQAWYNRGISLNELKRYEEAIESLDKAIAIKPDYDWAWYNRGISLANLKRYEEAIESYDKAIAIKPDDREAWNGRGNSLEQLNRYQEALESYDQAIKINPNYQLAINNRERLLKKLNENK